MFKSLKEWINLPVQVKPFVGRDGTGEAMYGDVRSTKCYAAGNTQLITDTRGTEVVSTSQLYFDGSELISIQDCIIFEDRESNIKNISTFYSGGKPDVKVVYL